MAVLSIPKLYKAEQILFELHIDQYRTGLHNLFNTNKLDQNNFSGSMTIPAAKFISNEITDTDTDYIVFGSSNQARWGLDGDKNMVFETIGAHSIVFKAIDEDFEFTTTNLKIPGDIVIGSGGSGRTVLQAIATYKKPVLEWVSTSIVQVQNNSGTDDETVIYFPGFVAVGDADKYRQADIGNTANGYGTGDTGAAQGGRRASLSATTNSYYAVYAAKVRSGDDFSATTARFVIVYDNIIPTPNNEGTLNTRYGENNWIYLGTIRYGQGATGTNNIILKFVHTRNGWCMYEQGPYMAYTTTDADNTSSPLYTVSLGMTGAVIPSAAGHMRLNLTRERVSDWYIREAAGEDIIWRLMTSFLGK